MRYLQIWHLCCLAIIPILFCLFRLSSEPHDADRVLVDNLFVVGGALWAGITTVYFVVTGTRNDALESVLHLYRNALGKMGFLFGSNLIGTALVGVLLFQLIAYRPVEFVANFDAELSLNDRTGEELLVGLIRARVPTAYRLPWGQHHIVFRRIGESNVAGAATVHVPPIFFHPQKVRTTLRLTEDREYGKTK